ncbi:helix-turn-helix transcriptional regulator [Pseudoprimorskyibacter insulae]|uniref:HTH-type transcriptional regulator RamB n=1 Tax=Pseudoprimorskyibacter insulae TaxID=1695997 RepID=A0A2R8AZT0_9RHOB|nr:helix-turn-helix transcriptional regulator [Pseudoprimorskyibacter insulae]SPF81552.1 HTH-type transcriptional regulator RamB [Pseudoprimorskyibacter insulae]
MSRDTLTGSRIRERRVMLGLKQSDLARRADISASYLNLIEHNRRRIGGKLLLVIADVLGVEPATLTEGAEATLIATLREAAGDAPKTTAELDRLDEFAGRFPGWAGLLAENRSRVTALERTVSALNDRLTHDPHLAEALHEVLTTVTAIRSTASILAEPGEIEIEWQQRFHRNINEDAARLADTSRALAQYLDRVDDDTTDVGSPQDELDAVLARHGFYFPELEAGTAPADFLGEVGAGLSRIASYLLAAVLERFAADAKAVPSDTLLQEVKEVGPDPFAIALRLGLSPAQIMRRIGALAKQAGLADVGVAICDASGSLTFRQPSNDLQFPRFGAACTMLPLYQALSQPVMPIVTVVELPGANPTRLLTYSYAEPVRANRADQPRLLEATMLAVPVPAGRSFAPPVGVGVSCGICSRDVCPGRREPSILSEGF